MLSCPMLIASLATGNSYRTVSATNETAFVRSKFYDSETNINRAGNRKGINALTLRTCINTMSSIKKVTDDR